MTSVDHWREWKARCALALCAPAAQEALRDFVARRTRTYLAASRARGGPAEDPDEREAWHGFETYFVLNRRRSGKSYKDWLFARGTDPAAPGAPTLPALESGASLLLRDVVRERLRRERAPARVRSLQEPVAGAGQAVAVTLEDLLPGGFDTVREVDRRELERLAMRLADTVLAGLSRRERIALLARERGLSCAHPAVCKAAGCGKTALAEAYHSALQAVAGHVRRDIPREPACVQAALSVAVFEAVRQCLKTWDRAEHPLSGFLYG